MTPAPSLPFPSAPVSTAPSTAAKPSVRDTASKDNAAATDNDAPSRDFNAVFSKCAPKAKSDKNAAAANRGNTAKADAESSASDGSSESSESADSSESTATDVTAAIMTPFAAEPVVVSPMALWALRFQKQFGGKEPTATATSTDIAHDSSVKPNVTTATLGCVTPPVPSPNAPQNAASQPVRQIDTGTNANVIATVAATTPAVSSFQPQVRPDASSLITSSVPASASALSNPVSDFKSGVVSATPQPTAAAAIETASLPLPQPQEKLAATTFGVTAASSDQPLAAPVGEFLNVEKQQLAKPPADVGTEVAKPLGKMAFRSDKFAVEPRTPEVGARVAHSSDAVAPVGSTKRSATADNAGSNSSQSDANDAGSRAASNTANTTGSVTAAASPAATDAFSTAFASESVSAAAPANSSALANGSASTHASAERLHEVVGRASDAAGAVREVVDMTHEFRARERSSVEVKFNFKDDTELSVRIAVKAGEVQTTFRTDSAELRSTLGREWQQQLAANASDAARTARLVDPVFTSNSAGQGSTSANGGDAQRQSFSQHEQSAANRGESFANSFNSMGTRGGSTTSARPAVSHRPETVRHLHVFA